MRAGSGDGMTAWDKLQGSAVFSDDAESADAAWTAKGFSRVGAPITDDYAQYYVAYGKAAPLAGAEVADTNTKIKIVKEAKDGSTISVQVGPAVK